MSGDRDETRVETLLDTPDLADALGSDRFKQFLDHVPVGVAVAELGPTERVVYANPEFERLTGVPIAEIGGGGWEILSEAKDDDGRSLTAAVTQASDYIGAFRAEPSGEPIRLDVWSNVIEDDDGAAVFRLVALVARTSRDEEGDQVLDSQVAAKDQQLRELQHRVKNNLQLITSLIRFEARGLPEEAGGERFDRLAGRVGVLSLLYHSLMETETADRVDLGVYLSQVASAAMRAQATEGIHLDLQVDTLPVSVNVAMPTGLVVNELLTNALKHAFPGREGGTIQLQGLIEPAGWRVVVADDGVGLPPDSVWPTAGTLPALFVRSLQQNAHATIEVASQPGRGVRAEILFSRADAAPTEMA
ncbi:MAG: histidine kinase [Caulobacteraceae bacterium]|nr:histidine kinase [Caulobacteraceae bacterium]